MIKIKNILLASAVFIVIVNASAQNFPTATELAKKMNIGWNIGNTMEATWSNDAWSETYVNQRLIDSVKAAGFNTIRIPVAWDYHSTNNVIDPAWFTRVKQVVDYCIGRQLYVVINIHWDNGWLENNCTLAKQVEVNAKQKTYWTQIANYFKDYNEYLLFAGTNEPNVEDATQMTVLLSYLQTFVSAVRATGGNNSQRILIVQGPGTDTEKTNSLMNTLPTDNVQNRRMVEVHYYSPYQYCLMTEDANWGTMFYYWGKCFHSTSDASRNPTWGEEAFMDAQFQAMKTKFVDKGYPVIIGEFGVNKRTNLSGDNYNLHISSRNYYLRYFAHAAKRYGLLPYYWDPGFVGNNSTTLFERSTGKVLDRDAVNALMSGTYGSLATMNCNVNDCKGVYNGNAYTNSNGECVLGYKATAVSIPDCNGVANGTAILDKCGRCTGGNTGLTACTPIKTQAETICSFDGTIDTDNAGFEGTGYINSPNAIGAKLTLYIDAQAAGSIWFGVTYANGGTSDRPAQIIINDIQQSPNLLLPVTNAWTTYKTTGKNINLQQGVNKVELLSTTSDGLPNIDYFELFGNAVFSNCPTEAKSIHLKKGRNIIAYPSITPVPLATALKDIWQNVVSVKNFDGFYDISNPQHLNSLTELQWGIGYYILVNSECTILFNE
ncbi:MAG: cellulase family glycosylhydrolase [Bacteroidales bacterium]|nr:cellulase family glycosylhydrolase [Bacteroidales bacterium]